MVVFYGSQTGTAEDFATRLCKDASRYQMKAMAADPEEYDMVKHWHVMQSARLAMLVLSAYQPL